MRIYNTVEDCIYIHMYIDHTTDRPSAVVVDHLHRAKRQSPDEIFHSFPVWARELIRPADKSQPPQLPFIGRRDQRHLESAALINDTWVDYSAHSQPLDKYLKHIHISLLFNVVSE